jgi:hypothetical protein
MTLSANLAGKLSLSASEAANTEKIPNSLQA